MDEDTQRLVKRLIDTWGDDLGELTKLVELVVGIRWRGMAFERELCARIADSVAESYLSFDGVQGASAVLEVARLIRERVKVE